MLVAGGRDDHDLAGDHGRVEPALNAHAGFPENGRVRDGGRVRQAGARDVGVKHGPAPPSGRAHLGDLSLRHLRLLVAGFGRDDDHGNVADNHIGRGHPQVAFRLGRTRYGRTRTTEGNKHEGQYANTVHEMEAIRRKGTMSIPNPAASDGRPSRLR